jgi:hypothetical protein
MHASIWHFSGDPDELLRAYDAVSAELPAPALQLCLRAPGGIVLVDTCPSQAAFEGVLRSPHFRALRQRHGLPDPDRVEGFPVHAAHLGAGAGAV